MATDSGYNAWAQTIRDEWGTRLAIDEKGMQIVGVARYHKCRGGGPDRAASGPDAVWSSRLPTDARPSHALDRELLFGGVYRCPTCGATITREVIDCACPVVFADGPVNWDDYIPANWRELAGL